MNDLETQVKAKRRKVRAFISLDPPKQEEAAKPVEPVPATTFPTGQVVSAIPESRAAPTSVEQIIREYHNFYYPREAEPMVRMIQGAGRRRRRNRRKQKKRK